VSPYNLHCEICPNTQGWDFLATKTELGLTLCGKAIAQLTTSLEFAEFAGPPEAFEEGKDPAVDLARKVVAEEAASRTVFEDEVARIKGQDCAAIGDCRLNTFLGVLNRYMDAGEEMVARYRQVPGDS